jgi:CheY-like chemotaxis protein
LIGEDVDFQIFRGTALRLVQVDTGQIEQVILNLAVNARDAMPQGGTLRIETINRDIEQDGVRREYVMLAVSDTGVGILPEARAHLFEPFFTTKEKGKGTGLGLATVYGIVKQAGGNVSVDSATGKGTRFEVLFPATDAQNEPAAASKPTGMQRGTGTILVVDDEPQVRATAARVLREAGYTVFEAADGGQAMAIAETLPKLDLLLTDVVMPRMSGFELASQLGRSTLDLKVIFMSGYSSDVRSLAIQPAVRFATLLEKPFTVGSLTGAVRERLNAPLIPATASSRPPSSTIRQPT